MTENFTQKWVIVAFLEPAAEGTEFFRKDWSPHVTLAPTFAVDWETTALFDKLAAALADQKPIELIAEEELHWGANGEIHVIRLQKTPEIAALHEGIMSVLSDAGAVFNDPQYIGDNFIPHSTVQKQGRLQVGDTVTISALTIVDMFPHGDGYQRKILRTIQLSA